MDEQIRQARTLLEGAASVFVLTGAGISAESGLRTYRDSDLSWRGMPYQDVVNVQFFERDPRASWDWHLEFRAMTRAVEPNAAHRALAAWAIRHGRVTLMTQNIDGLHERAGHPDPIRFHGSVWITRCTACDASREDEALEYPSLPMCAACGAPERPGVVWFGDAIPRPVIERAQGALQQARAFLLIGTSALVHPAASVIDIAHRKGIPIIEVNPGLAHANTSVHLKRKAGEILPALLG